MKWKHTVTIAGFILQRSSSKVKIGTLMFDSRSLFNHPQLMSGYRCSHAVIQAASLDVPLEDPLKLYDCSFTKKIISIVS